MELATIQRIIDVQPVENSDNLDVVSILGWKVVTRRNEYKAGDLCVYVGLDSILPEREEFEFMRQKNFRVKTVKLRGQVSQGIVFPLSILNESEIYNVGDNVTEPLGILKYEKQIPAQLRGMAKGSFPSFIRKTDEERLQNIPEILDELKNVECYFSVKIYGTS